MTGPIRVLPSTGSERHERRDGQPEVLAFGPWASFAISSSDPAALEWLLEFFGPALTPADSPPDWSLRVEPSREARERWRDTRPAQPEERVCFAFDSGPIRLPCWEAVGGFVIDDDERSCVIHVRDREIAFTGEPGTRRWRFSVLLVLQELVAAAMRSDHLQLHAAAAECDGRALVLAGPKEAGKTTILLRLLRAGGWALMGNDRAFASEVDGEGVVHAMPLAVNLREDTANLFPELRLRPRRLTRPYLHTVAELETARGPAASVGKRSDALTPAQVADSLAVPRSATGAIAAFVFPDVNGDDDGWALDALRPAEVRDLLASNRWGLTNPPTVFSELAAKEAFDGEEVAQRLATAVPGFRLRLGRGSMHDAGLERALRELAVHNG